MMALYWSLACLILACLSAAPTDSARILTMPYHHKSHVGIFAEYAKALIKDGHEVWMLTLEKYEEKVKKSGATPILFTVPDHADFTIQLDDFMAKYPDGDGGDEGAKAFVDMLIGFGLYCDELMTNERVMKTIQDTKFDLAVVDGTMYSMCIYMVPYKFDIPYITVHGFQVTAWDAGVTGMPSIEPEISTVYSNRMTFWERLDNFKIWHQNYHNVYSATYSESHMAKYAGDKPKITFTEVIRKSEMFLMNFEIMCLDYPRVSAPNYQFLGASTASEAKALPADLEEFVAGAEHGVVVMSMGTMKAFQHVWHIIRDKVFKAFGRLQQRVIVQYTLKDKPSNVPDNVRIMEYLPQNDLLGHPKTKLFVTHGGNNGQNEAVFHGIPSLVIPVSIDQPYSGVRVETHGYGLHVRDKSAITSEELYNMMSEILNNETYTKNIKKCSAIVRSMPSATEKFTFWVNHILQFGGAHLRPPSLDMPMYQVLMLDIVAYYVALGLAALHVTLFAIYYAYTRLCRGSKSKRD